MPRSITRRRTGCVVCRQRRISWIKETRFVHESSLHAGQRWNSNPPKLPQSSSSNGSPVSGTMSRDVVPRGKSSSFPTPSNGFAMYPGSSGFNANARVDFLDQRSQTPTFSASGRATNSSVTEICRSESARLREFIEIEHASPVPPNLNPNPEGFTDWHALGVSEELLSALTSQMEITLLKNYIWECAPWFDAQNSKENFSKTDVPRMMNCPPWRAAALAVSAKNMELRKGKGTGSGLSLPLYQLAVRLAIDSISGRFDCVGTLAGCVLLTVYEMMTVSYTDWRRHLQGCASIYVHNNWNGSTGGLISASFWNYARFDIWAAFCSSTNTIISPDFWFDKPEDIMSLTNVDEDQHAQISTWLLGRTVNLVHRDLVPGSASLMKEFDSLREDLSKWDAMGSVACQAILYRDASPDEDSPYPQILFSRHSSIIAHTMFHTAMVLLLEYEQSKSLDAMYFHSRMACGIIKTNERPACLVNSLQPMWICARHLRTRVEKLAALEVLVQIETRTGWQCDWRSRGLGEFWALH